MGLLIAIQRTSTQQTNPRSRRPEQTCLTGMYSSTCKHKMDTRCQKNKNSYKIWKISTRQCFNGDFHSTVSIHEMINSNVQHRFEEVPLNPENSSVKLQVYQGVFSPRSLQGFGCRRSLGSSWLLEWRARFAAFCRSGSQRHAAASYLYKWKWQLHFISCGWPLNSLCGGDVRGRCLPFVFLWRQSMPRKKLDSLTCLALTSVMVWIGFRPLFSASAIGITSRASAKDLMAYCSNVGH